MLARYCVLLAVSRMIARGHADGVVMERLPDASLGPTEPWMKAAAHADLLELFRQAPLALRYVLHNPGAMPAEVPDELDAAGLLVHRHGKRVEIEYGQKQTRPYAAAGLNRRPGS